MGRKYRDWKKEALKNPELAAAHIAGLEADAEVMRRRIANLQLFIRGQARNALKMLGDR